MAKMSVSESDFEALASATLSAEARGDMAEAVELDKLARKVNAALTVSRNRAARRMTRMATGKKPDDFTWQNVPSLLGLSSARKSATSADTPASN